MLKRSGFARKVYEPSPREPVKPIPMGERRGVIRAVAAVGVVVPKEVILRSEPYRRYVAEQECFLCRVEKWSQCAHENEGKGAGLKVCDSRSFPACAPHWGLPGCHFQFDHYVDISREEARELGAKLSAQMRERAVAAGWKFSPQGITR